MMRVKAVLFDLDETLTDAPTGLEAAHRAVAGRLHQHLVERGVEVDEAPIRSKLKVLDDRMNMETKYNRDAWWPVLLEEIGTEQKISHSLIEELTQLYWATFAEVSRPYADAEPTLSYLGGKGYKLGLVTDMDGKPGMKRKRIERIEFIKLFDVIVVGGEDTPRTKPSPEPFLLAASKLGLSTSDCVFIGDKPFTDIKGAKTTGMRTILVKRRDWGVEEHPDLTIKSLSELRGVL